MDHAHWVRLIRLGLIVLTVVALGGVCRNDFIDMDDGVYVAENPAVQAGLTTKGLKWAVTTFHAGYWQPLTWLSLQLDAQFDAQFHGDDPKRTEGQPHAAFVYHVTNLVLHLACVLLLFGVLRKMTGADGSSAVVAALFAVHPMHVESVAWVAERKDVLSTLFWILTMGAYRRYAAAPSVGRYLLVLVSYMLGLMAKPALVTLPFVLLLLDYWPLKRSKRTTAPELPSDKPTSVGASWGWLIVEKLPMLCLLVAFSAVTFYAQQRVGAVIPVDKLSLEIRVGNALTAYVAYLGTTFWPINLAVFYPLNVAAAYPHAFQAPPWRELGAAAAILSAVTLLAAWRARRQPYLLIGWLWFIGTLVPVIGLAQAGEQARADRFCYVPHIGLFIMLIWGGADLLARCRAPAFVGPSLACAVLAGCVLFTWRQVGYWRDSTTLWEHTLQVTTNNYKAHGNYGLVLFHQQKFDEAARHFNQAVQFGAGSPTLYYNLGVARLAQGHLPDAAQAFSEALRLRPQYGDALNNLGVVLLRMRQFDEARQKLSEAVQIDPNRADTHFNLGVALLESGRLDEAVTHFNDALALQPDYADARANLGVALMREGKLAEAEQAFAALVRQAPNNVQGHVGLGFLAFNQGKLTEAKAHFQEAAQRDPTSAETLNTLGVILSRQERWSEAVPQLLRAVELQRGAARYYADLAYAFHGAKQVEAAVAAYRDSLRLDPNWPQTAAASAWMMATSQQAEARNPGEAIYLARQAIQALELPRPEFYDALAAALAAASRFEEAVTAADKAIALAEGRKLGAYAKKIKERHQLYADKKAYVNTRGEPQMPKP